MQSFDPVLRVAERFCAWRALIARSVRAAFPRTPPERVEDAVADAGEAALAHAGSIAAWDERAQLAWMQVVARRSLRGTLRRRYQRAEVVECGEVPLLPLMAGEGDPEALARAGEVLRRLDGAIEVSARQVRRHTERVAHALRLLVGDPDLSIVDAANACGVRREYVSRARADLRHRLST